MVCVRLTRIGRRNQPSFRLVAIDSHKSVQALPLEVLAAYNPKAKDNAKLQNVKKERLEYWLKNGAQLSATVKKLLTKEKYL